MNIMNQDKYFDLILKYIKRTKEELSFRGYDSIFMDRDKTNEVLNNAVERGVEIYALFPESTEVTPDIFKEKSDLVKMVKITENLPKGIIYFDDFGWAGWDSTKLTIYELEKLDGVIYREYYVTNIKKFREKIKKDHLRLRNEILELIR